MAKPKLKFVPKEMADTQRAMFNWCVLSLKSFHGEDVPEEILEQAAFELEEALVDLPGPFVSGSA